MKRRGIESGEVTDAMLNLAFAFKKNNEPAESRNNYEQGACHWGLLPSMSDL